MAACSIQKIMIEQTALGRARTISARSGIKFVHSHSQLWSKLFKRAGDGCGFLTYTLFKKVFLWNCFFYENIRHIHATGMEISTTHDKNPQFISSFIYLSTSLTGFILEKGVNIFLPLSFLHLNDTARQKKKDMGELDS